MEGRCHRAANKDKEKVARKLTVRYIKWIYAYMYIIYYPVYKYVIVLIHMNIMHKSSFGHYLQIIFSERAGDLGKQIMARNKEQWIIGVTNYENEDISVKTKLKIAPQKHHLELQRSEIDK